MINHACCYRIPITMELFNSSLSNRTYYNTDDSDVDVQQQKYIPLAVTELKYRYVLSKGNLFLDKLSGYLSRR